MAARQVYRPCPVVGSMPSGEECAGAPPRSIARVDCKPVRMMIIECFGRLGYFFFCARHADGPQARQAGAGRAAAQPPDVLDDLAGQPG